MKQILSLVIFLGFIPVAMASQSDVDDFNTAKTRFASAYGAKLKDAPDFGWDFYANCANSDNSYGDTRYETTVHIRVAEQTYTDSAGASYSDFHLFREPVPFGSFSPVRDVFRASLTDLPRGDLGQITESSTSPEVTLLRTYTLDKIKYWISYHSEQYTPTNQWSISYCTFHTP